MLEYDEIRLETEALEPQLGSRRLGGAVHTARILGRRRKFPKDNAEDRQS